MGNIRHGAYDSTLEDEIHRTLNELANIGIKNSTKIEASALIAEKNKRARMTVGEVKDFIAERRGMR